MFLSKMCVVRFGLIASRLAPTLECVLPVGASLLATAVVQSLPKTKAGSHIGV